MKRKVVKLHKDSSKALIESSFVLTVATIFSSASIYFSYPYEAFQRIFLGNEKILDIYWNSILILLTILIPISIETIQYFRKHFNNNRYVIELYLYRVAKAPRYFLLVPIFSFLLLFLYISEGGPDELVIFLYTFSLYLWATLFWYFSDIIIQSIRLLSNRDECLDDLLYKELEDLTTYNDSNKAGEEWESVWIDFGEFREIWQKRFLSLFWKMEYLLFSQQRFNTVASLLEHFSDKFLSIRDEKIRKEVSWLNERKRQIWFHGKSFSDGVENSFAVFARLLDFFYLAYKERESFFTRVSGEVFESGIDRLYRTVRDILQFLIDDELSGSNDSSYGLFKQLTEHINVYIESDDESDKVYVRSLPVYTSVFEHANNYSLQEYGFPSSWRLSIQNVDSLFGEKGDPRMRLIWLNHFLNWSSRRIDHGEKDLDNQLDGAVEMLFPDMHNAWIALWLGFRNLSWGRDRVDSLCQWDRNFGFSSYVGEVYSYDQSKSEEENEREMFARDEALKIQSKKNTAKVLMKLQAFGTADDINNLKITLQSLEGKYQNNRFAELNRLELLELANFMLETK